MATKRNLHANVGRLVLMFGILWGAAIGLDVQPAGGGEMADAALEKIGVERGICVVLGLPKAGQPGLIVDLAKKSELIVYFQSPSADEVGLLQEAAETAGLLGGRLFVDQGNLDSIHVADNLADAVLIAPSAAENISRDEILRVLHPEGKAIARGREFVKPQTEGVDDWSHPYHGPDNNPQSTDQIARAPYLTQFLADPKFCPMPVVSVAAGGRVFKAFGHIAHRANQNPMLNRLLCINAYNGTVLWSRALKEGFMIHRNTMIATPDVLYLADDQSCKLIDARTGVVSDEIVTPDGLADGPVWKWMALQDGVLYALIGGREAPIQTQRSDSPAMGHWPWGMWDGHDYANPKTNFGFGRTLVAIDPATKQIRWSHREDDYLDSRGVCAGNNRIYFYSPQKSVGCLDATTGDVLWKNSSADLLEAIGLDGPAQHYVTGYSTTTFIKCNDQFLFFAGPQRSRLVVASTDDGSLVWQKEHGNLQLVLRDDGLYAAGPQIVGPTPGPENAGFRLDYETGKELAPLPLRRACTRATGSVDSIFYRAPGGTIRVNTASNRAEHIAPMRPPCHDGVIIANGLLYWGPWMCGCQLSLYGHVCLAPAGGFDFQPEVDDSRLETGPGDPTKVQPLDLRPGDWPSYRGDSRRTSVARVAIPGQMDLKWTRRVSPGTRPTAPVTAGGLVFVGDHGGVVRALDASSGELRWKAYTASAVYFPPEVAEGRLFVGSADGRVYAFEAATGRRLWRFRAAPADRWIPVYGKLISTWPVAGGVVVDDGVVYAAAGIAHYDGTHVYALDAVTGKVIWHNGSSGAISKVNSGASLQGNLYLRDGELRFLGGNVHETARYDLKTGRCLNEPRDTPDSTYRTAFYPYYPAYGSYLSLDHTFADGRSLVYDASYEGSVHGKLTLNRPLPPGAAKPVKLEARWSNLRRQRPNQNAVWEDQSGRVFHGFVVTDAILLAAGRTTPSGTTRAFLTAISVKDGSDVWSQELPAPAVKGGTAMDEAGRVFVSLENGQVRCFGEAR